ncbi:MAG: diaminopropionate ammonia-lyase [Streptosporangiales bacterium]|nr:diaminopropionate ammonia-lyase [Streptosporangiales bacterium]
MSTETATLAGWYARPEARTWTCPPAPAAVGTFHRSLPGYAPTPLTELPALAAELGVRRVFVKDESARLGLGAFKVLGASYAVARELLARAGDPGPATLDRVRAVADPSLRLVTATDGNHGRAVAHVAALLGLSAHVYVPQVTDTATIARIEGEGARVTVVDAPYDDTVKRAAEAAEASGGVLVQDTAWPGYEKIPGWIVDGYATLFREVDAQLAEAGVGAADLVTLPIGVGSLAQAGVIHHRSGGSGGGSGSDGSGGSGGSGVALLGAEPDTAACVLAGLHAGEAVTVPTGKTVMAGLNCGTPSSIAWPYFTAGLDAAVAVTDAAAEEAVRDLGALGVASGPSGASSLAAVRAALLGPGAAERRTALGDPSTLVLLSTEGLHTA